MRVLVVDTYYPDFVLAHYAEREGLESRPYEEQLSSLIERCFGTSDAYSRAFRGLGHEAAELIANCLPLQESWASERGRHRALRALRAGAPGALARAPAHFLLQRIVQAQIADYDPEVVYFQDLLVLSPSQLRALRGEGRLVVGQIASEPPGDDVLESFDLLISSFPHFVESFRTIGVPSEYLRIAFDELVLERLSEEGIDPSPGAERPHAVSTVTSLYPDIHARRVPLLERLSDAIETDIWGYRAEYLPAGSPILERYHGQAWGLDMYRVYAQSKMVINAHEDVGKGHANNMRLYEATGTGALLFTENYENLVEMFESGREVIAYDDVDDLIEKVRYYLDHDEERRQIAAAGQARTLADHTYARRVEQLVPWLERALAER